VALKSPRWTGKSGTFLSAECYDTESFKWKSLILSDAAKCDFVGESQSR